MARAEWIFCWLCYRLALVVSGRWPLHMRLLPYAGLYAYSEDFNDYRRRRTGFCTTV